MHLALCDGRAQIVKIAARSGVSLSTGPISVQTLNSTSEALWYGDLRLHGALDCRPFGVFLPRDLAFFSLALFIRFGMFKSFGRLGIHKKIELETSNLRRLVLKKVETTDHRQRRSTR
jgi:hypothetical protein